MTLRQLSGLNRSQRFPGKLVQGKPFDLKERGPEPFPPAMDDSGQKSKFIGKRPVMTLMQKQGNDH
jgi:hypothetical protein